MRPSGFSRYVQVTSPPLANTRVAFGDGVGIDQSADFTYTKGTRVLTVDSSGAGMIGDGSGNPSIRRGGSNHTNFTSVLQYPSANNTVSLGSVGNAYKDLVLAGTVDHDGAAVGFFGVTPAARPAATAEIKAALALLGLLTDGGASPLDLDGGALTAGTGTFAGLVTANAGASIADGQDVTIAATTGSKLGQTASKIGMWGATPIAQPVGGVALTNNVTVGGTDNTIADVTTTVAQASAGGSSVDLATVPAKTDVEARLLSLRNNDYQLARKLRLVVDALRTAGILKNADV